MRRKILACVALLAIVAGAAFFTFAPGYVERALNPLNAPAEGWPVSAQAQMLHDGLVIGDWHSDALLWDRDILKRSTRGHTDVPRLLEGNVALQVFTTVTKSPRNQNYRQNSSDAPDNITPLFVGQLRPVRSWLSLRERALVQAEALDRAARAAPDRLRLIRTRGDLQDVLRARAGGQKILGALLGSEGAHPLEGRIENLEALHDAGFRVMGLTHFFDNELGGSLHGEGGTGTGLTEFGRQVVEALIQRSMVIDLAHASPVMVRDVLAIDAARPVLSHTGIQGHCASHRNLDDALVRAIAAKGGLIGIGYWQDVVCGGTPGHIAASIASAIALVGEDHVSLGSDYDGSVGVPFDAAQLPALTNALLDTGLTSTQIAKVMGGNMMRYLLETLPED